MHRQHEDLQCRLLVLDLLDQLDTVSAGHRQVEHQHVGVRVAHERDRGRTVARFAGYVEATCVLQDVPQAVPDEGVVVGDEYLGHDSTSPWQIA